MPPVKKNEEAAASTAVAEVRNTLPAGLNMDELLADAAHNPQMSSDDVALPYLGVLQDLSPQLKRQRPEYIEGAQAGMFFNNVTGEVFEGETEGLMVVPCYYERRLVEWTPREAGGGWVGDYPSESDILKRTRPDDKGRPKLPNGNIIVETAYQYVLVFNPDRDAWEQAVIAMKSTMLKANRRWNNMIVTSTIPGTDRQAPRFLYPYNLKTVLETKNDQSWYNFVMVRHEEVVQPNVYQNAKRFAELCKAGVVRRVVEVDGHNVDANTGEILDDNAAF
jgi:hypothetical protein